MVGGSSFIVILLAAFGFNAAQGVGKVLGVGQIEAKGVEFRPIWRDYWSTTSKYLSGKRLDLTKSKYYAVSIELLGGGIPEIKVKELDDLPDRYSVLAISKLVVKKPNSQLIWTTICNRSILDKEKIHKMYPNAIKFILIKSADKDRIQFQCPPCAKHHLNISFIPDGQSKPWTPRRGKLALYHLRMRPFKGFQLLFPKVTVVHSAEVADEVLEIEGTTSANAKMIMTILFDQLQKQTDVDGNSCAQFHTLMDVVYKLLHALKYYDKWVIDAIRRLRQLHNKMDGPCDESGAKFVPHLLDYWHGIVSPNIRLLDYPYIVLTLDKEKKLDYKLYKTLPSIRKVALVATSELNIPDKFDDTDADEVTHYDLVWTCSTWRVFQHVRLRGYNKLSDVVQNRNNKHYIFIKPKELKQLKTLECKKEGKFMKFYTDEVEFDKFEDEMGYLKMSDIVNTFATGLEADGTTMQDNLDALKKLVNEQSLQDEREQSLQDEREQSLQDLDPLSVQNALARFATVFGEYERAKSRSLLVGQAKQCLVPDGTFSKVFQKSFIPRV